jgi:hypothetical protein
VPQGHDRRCGSHGRDDEEHPAPRQVVDQPAAHEGARRRRDSGQSGPRTDGPAAVLGPHRRVDQGDAARHEERAPDALCQPGRDQQRPVRRQAARQGGRGEPHQTDQEDPAPPVAVTERSTQQQQRPESEQVPVHHPLLHAQASAEIAPDRRQRQVHHRPVQECRTGAQHRGGDEPTPIP